MKHLVFSILILMGFGPQAFADYSFDDVLAKYSQDGFSGECGLRYDDNAHYTEIKLLGVNRPTMVLKFEDKTIHVEGTTYVFQENFYDGMATAIFVEMPHKLLVTTTWADNDSGKDQASFCELPKI